MPPARGVIISALIAMGGRCLSASSFGTGSACANGSGLEEPKFAADSRKGENLSILLDRPAMSLSLVHITYVKCP